MKKVMLFALTTILWAGVALAQGPYLICDPTAEADAVTNFKIFMDAAPAVDSVPVARAIKYDLSGVSAGVHTVKAQACNVWGCSVDSLPFVFNKKVPSAPLNIRIP